MKNLHILIVEDDVALADSIATFLKPLGETTIANDGLTGMQDGQDNIYDIAILDLMLPDKNGYDILNQWRNQDHLKLPVLILTAKDTIADKVQGFSNGADDYLTKPFHREELLLRVKAILKRTGNLDDNNQINAGPFHVDLNNHTVDVNDQTLQLNGKEYDLLVYFLQNPNIVITKEQIFDRLWGFDSETILTVVEVYMSNLRKKLKKVLPDSPIKTIRNVGYICSMGDAQ